ncbi:MAG: MFS transporter, partial [Candidatus Binatia bacterium]
MKAETTPPAAEPVAHDSALRRLYRRVFPETGGYPMYPLLILFGLNLVDEFDIQALGILGPNIRDAFGLSNSGLAGIRAAAALVGLLVPFIGWLGDRSNRVRMSWTAGAVWGVFAFCTGLVPASMIWLFVIVRMGSGTAKLVNFPVHISLLFDYYPAHTRGRVLGFYRGADAWAAMAGPALAGLVAWLLGWRAAFFLLAIPTFFLVFLAVRLREPVRGEMENREAAVEAAEEPAVPFDRAVRWLYSVPTLKRIFLGAFCTGLGGVAYAIFFPVFLEEVFGVEELGRGLIASSAAPLSLVGLWLSGRITDHYQRTKTMAHVTAFFGFSVVALALVLALIAASPNLATVVIINLFIG